MGQVLGCLPLTSGGETDGEAPGPPAPALAVVLICRMKQCMGTHFFLNKENTSFKKSHGKLRNTMQTLQNIFIPKQSFLLILYSTIARSTDTQRE